MFARSQNNNNNNSKKKNSSVSSVAAVGGQTTSMSVSSPAAASTVKSRTAAATKRSRNRTNASASLSASPGELQTAAASNHPNVVVRTPAAATLAGAAAAAHSPFDRAVRSGPVGRTGAGAIRGSKGAADVAGLQTGAPSPVQLLSVRSLESDDSIGASYSSDSSCSGYQGRQRQQQGRHRYSDVVFAVGGSPVMMSSSMTTAVSEAAANFGVDAGANGSDTAGKLALNNNEDASYDESVQLNELAAGKVIIRCNENTRKLILDKSSENCINGQRNSNGIHDVKEFPSLGLRDSVQTAVTAVQSDEPRDPCTPLQPPTEFDQDFDGSSMPAMPTHAVGDDTSSGDADDQEKFTAQYGPISLKRLALEFCRMNSDFDDPVEEEPSYGFPPSVAEFIADETILPPPELFENGCSFHSNETDQDVVIGVDILPPPEEFGSQWHLVASNQTNVDQTETGSEIVLPPPELFGASDPDAATEGTNHCNNQVREVTPVDQHCDIHDADDPDVLQSPNGKLDEEVRSTENVKEIVNALEARLNCHSPVKGPGSELITIKVVAEVNPKTRSEEESIHQVPMYAVPSRQRLASDAMEKLDALCKSHEIPVERKTFTRIPVYHETTASANQKILHRKAVAESWPGGIFSQDRMYNVAGTDESTKRHSTGATIGNIGARPNVPTPKPKIFLEELERKRKEEHFRTSTDGVEKASDPQSPQRRLFTRYTPDGREFCFHSGCDRIEFTEGRQKSLDRGDLRQKNESVAAATPRRPLVVSEGDISKSSLLIDWSPEDSQQYCGQQLTAKSKLAAVRKNLLEKASERRKESRMVSKSSSPPAVDSNSSEPTSAAAEEKSDIPSKVDLPNNESTSPVVNVLSTKLSNTTVSSCSSLSEHSSLEIWQKSSPTASSDSGTADIAPRKATRRLETSKSLDASSFSDITGNGIQRQLSVERSVETMQVSRPASIVLSAGKSALSTPELGSPVRVVVDGKEISAGNIQPSTAAAPQSITTGSLASTSTASLSADSSLPLLAPLCSPEASFDMTSSEIPSGRNSPSTISVSTFPGNSSSVGDLLMSPMPTDTGRHFIVVAIDFGTTYSGYAFSFVRDPDSVHMMRRWEGGDPGVVNQKTPTTLLLDPSGRFHSFGYAARDAYHDLDAQEAKKWLYFEKFKMALHYNAELNKETTIKASNGRPYLALSVFAHALHFFYDHALQELSDQSATTIVNDDIRWIITVPAIWKAPAKQFMRLAAYEAGIASADNPSQLLIALEPEAASVYVRKLRLYQLVPEPPYVAPPRREPTPDLSSSLDHVSDDEFNKSEDAIKYKTLPAVHLRSNFCPTSTTTTVGHEVDIEGTRYMVVDCGGGTVDITVYEMESRYGCLKELHKATGGPFGSVGVDLAFERLLVEIFGSDFIEAFKVKRPAGWVDLMAAFESRKRTASPFKSTPLNVSLPFSFIDYHKKCRSGHVEGVIRKYGSREVSWSSQGMLRLTTEAMRRLFQPTLDRIKVAIGDVLNHPNCRDIRYMFLVGGFSESPVLQLEMRKEFSHLLKIIIPQDVALTILKGAVIFGIDPTVVGVRRSRLTYGVGVLHRFVPGKHPQSKKITRDGSAWCIDVFDRFVAVDQEVAVGDVVVRSYAPARPGQRSTVIHIYCSDRTDVAFVTDPGVRRCGTLCLDLTDALYHDTGSTTSSQANTPRLRNRRREIRARMTFGDTEIRVDALDVATGRCVRAGIDFLNK